MRLRKNEKIEIKNGGESPTVAYIDIFHSIVQNRENIAMRAQEEQNKRQRRPRGAIYANAQAKE
jgi:hypothetical protein